MAGAITLREFVTKWGFEVDDAALKKLDASFFETRKNMQKVADKATQVGKSLSLFATAPILAFAGISTHLAAESADFEARLKTVFKGISDDGVKSLDTFGVSVGMSSIEIQKMVGGMGQLLQNMGYTETQAFDVSKSVASLSADIAEFNGAEGGAEAVQKDITAALKGRVLGLSRYGLSISDVDIKQRIAKNSSNGLKFANDATAKSQAILSLITEQSSKSVGAFTNATDDLGVSSAKLKAKMSNLSLTFGKMLLPIAIKITTILTNVVDKIQAMSSTTRTIILVVMGLVAALGPALIIFGSLINAVLAIRTAMVLFGNSAIVAWLKFFAGAALIVAAAAAIYIVMDDILGYFQGKDSITGAIIDWVDELVNVFQSKFPILGTIVRGVMVGILTPLNLFINAIRTVAGIAGTLMGGGGMAGVMDVLKQGALDAGAPIRSIADGSGFSLGESVGFGERSTLPKTMASGQSATTQNVTAPITVNVPQGTPPEQVGPAVQRGVSEGLSSVLRETHRQTKTAVVN